MRWVEERIRLGKNAIDDPQIKEAVQCADFMENERTGLAELVRAWGYEAETASDGVEGLQAVELWNPGIVITDLRMPRMDGMQLLENIAAQPQQVACPPK